MKKIAMIGLMLILANDAFCQTEVMIEQIVKLETYLGWLKKGYDIAKKGLTVINDIKHRDFNLHQDYFNSLLQVKGPIKNDAKIAAMIALQVEILNSYTSYYNRFRTSGVFTSQELGYLYNVFTVLMKDVEEDITALTAIVSDGSLEATDDQRVNRINQLYDKMTKQDEFLHSFGDATQLQMTQRQRELQEIPRLQKLYQP